ncbi:hypothetical protein N0V82_004650 [Gnomoniopsis sp. IMI 355080]|nr:hypothetical protein N0V82_004650 [Gnomoniopsis sp. IMI 355080]
MRPNILTGILAALVVVGDAKPLSSQLRPRARSHVLHEEVSPLQGTWAKSHRLHQDATLPVRIGLTQQNLHRAEEFINDVAHPASPNFGKHWSAHEVVEMFKPRRESVDAVVEWLEAEGIHPSRIKMTSSKSWLTFDATVREVEQMLKTQYHVYKHATSKDARHVACEKYHVPEHLAEHIDIITPSVHFDQHIGGNRKNQHKEVPEEKMDELRKRSADLAKRQAPVTGIVGSPLDGSNPKQGHNIDNAMMSLDQCDTMITPDCLRALYNIPKGTAAASNNTLGIVEYTPQAFLQSDLDMYFQEFASNMKDQSPEVVLLDNAVVQTQNKSFNFNGESALDLEFAMALISPQKATLYQVGDTTQGASFNNFLDGIDGSYCDFEGGTSKNPNIDGQYSASVQCGRTTATNVISTSYGSNEADLTPKYEQRQCDEYMKLALQGVSVIYSSGDFGVAGNGGQCLSENGTSFTNGDSGKFNPSFPGGCPWVTSVGATQIVNGSTVTDPEAACQEVIKSGGGFSNVFAMPSYQKDALQTYMEKHAPAYGADRFNNSGTSRGFPDVSANGANYVTAVDGKFSLSYGTSASAPVFASMINMINEGRLKQGKGPVGFLNPTLYANADVMNDIKVGSNPGCGTEGFSAVTGWDPLTGLGTPDYEQMQKLFLSLP